MVRSGLFATVALLLCTTLALAVGPGDAAPDFAAESTMGEVRLSDFQGKKNVVLAFYYKDFTGG